MKTLHEVFATPAQYNAYTQDLFLLLQSGTDFETGYNILKVKYSFDDATNDSAMAHAFNVIELAMEVQANGGSTIAIIIGE